MKKLIITLLLLSGTCFAKEPIKVFFPFQVPPNFVRKLLETANESQDKYQFNLEFKMGAGGAIAAASALNTPHSILISSSSFFTRSTMYINSLYDPNDFALVSPICSVPLVLISSKYSTLDEIDPDTPIFVSLSGGLGTSSHLLAEKLKKRFKNITMVPYAGAADVYKSVATSETDFGVTVLPQVKEFILSKRVNALAITGSTSHYDIPTLQKYKLTEANRLSTVYTVTVNSAAPTDEQNEFRKIIRNAISKHKEDYTREFCAPFEVTSDTWLSEELKFYQSISKDIKLTDVPSH
jgi:tripartite-type tricarboxylate transporter receptor subunit TctC